MKFNILYLLLLFSLCVGAQEYYDDAQIRFNLGLEKRITKRFSVTFDQQDRFQKNASDFTRASYDVGLNFKVNKFLKVKADYVFIQKKNKYEYFLNRNWYYIAVVLKHEMGKWKFFYRNLAQARMAQPNSEFGNITHYYDRNKLTVRYEATKRYSFWVAEEIYIPLNNPQSQGIDRTRSYLGLSIRTYKKQELDLYFMLQQQIQRGKWYDQNYKFPNQPYTRDFIYGVNYNIEF
jgi:hypothetical protein